MRLCQQPLSLPAPHAACAATALPARAPPPPAALPACLPAVFQQLEVDYAMAKPHPVYYPTDLREVPVLRMFGVTEGGSSVAAFVHGFEPYFYAEAPTPTFSPDDCQALTGELNVGGPA